MYDEWKKNTLDFSNDDLFFERCLFVEKWVVVYTLWFFFTVEDEIAVQYLDCNASCVILTLYPGTWSLDLGGDWGKTADFQPSGF